MLATRHSSSSNARNATFLQMEEPKLVRVEKFFFQGAYSCKRPCKEMHAAQMADVPGQ